jgi:protein required for attachment to host cells
MNTMWVLVAGASEAKVYAATGPDKALQEIAHFEHADSRKHARDITSDLPGRNVGSDGSHHAMEAETDIKQAEAVEFARQIDSYLRTGLNSHHYGKLVVIAMPAFLGHLRANMDTQVAKSVVYELSKNLLRCDAREIRAHLPQHL